MRDDFTGDTGYWRKRSDGNAGVELGGGKLTLWMGPSEALYYSNAEVSDGGFDKLPWGHAYMEARVRLLGGHYGSAGWGFWNYTMWVDENLPIWFIYLRAKGPYPLQGFFAQAGPALAPIKLWRPGLGFAASSILAGLLGARIASTSPSMQALSLEEWHTYRVEWDGREAVFLVDGGEAARLRPGRDSRLRADVWVDNAVYQSSPMDAGGVYRHVTQWCPVKATLEVDYVELGEL